MARGSELNAERMAIGGWGSGTELAALADGWQASGVKWVARGLELWRAGVGAGLAGRIYRWHADRSGTGCHLQRRHAASKQMSDTWI